MKLEDLRMRKRVRVVLELEYFLAGAAMRAERTEPEGAAEPVPIGVHGDVPGVSRHSD